MNQHVPSGRQLLGVALALFTSYTWATIPIILKLLVQWVDVYTLTWFRFQVAGLSSVLTMISYLSFGRALERAEASRFGVIITLMPLLTVLNMELVTSTFPQALPAPEQMTPVVWGGAVLVFVVKRWKQPDWMHWASS